MQPGPRPRAAVVLPGTGSNAAFAKVAFGPCVSGLSIPLIAVEPDPRRVIESYVTAMVDASQRYGPILVGGISLGAAAAVNWAIEADATAVAVLVALPPWTGASGSAPAALSAAFTAQKLRDQGLDSVTAEMRASSPPWLADTLTASWHQQWPDLPAALDEAARYGAPTLDDLSGCTVPVGICSAVDDPVHPLAVGEEWAARLPRAGLFRTTLDRIGADPAELGNGAVTALAATGFVL
ncbi:alpha/beta hydrolase [Antrihabitans cavernicola]|uniref:Alpha/beta hydrolase n=1 Tax=Antrihabitans cavernicola TaxID=2495913 RepID=A0A5A7SCW7_9NOCA|nr:alpha/beta hydrolase [Spelaeibacter cavernicola]